MEDKAGSALFRLEPGGKVISRRFCNLHICSPLRIQQFIMQKTQNASHIKIEYFFFANSLALLCLRTGNLLCYHTEIQSSHPPHGMMPTYLSLVTISVR